ncbi:MAG: polysaccharide biosynthesis protein, partial [Clostridia bacterium]|nr:polysaccharide biosynthesis protein [Clostridia bacterium]
MPGETFAYGATVLLLTNLANRALAFLYRLLMVRLLGAEGVGLYEMVFPVYSLVLVVTTAGLPLALAKLTAERTATGDWAQARRFFFLAATVLFLSGLFSAFFLWHLTPVLAGRVLADPRVDKALRLTVPALLVVPACSAFRGLFQGVKRLSRPAFSQLAEQVVRVTAGLYLAWRFLPRGLDHAAAGLVAGMVAGETAGFLYLLHAYWRERPLGPGGGRRPSLGLVASWRELWRLGFPVTVARIVAAVVLTLEAVLIPQRLQAAGYSLRQATDLYGQFAGIALTLVHLPTVLTISLAAAMVPAVAEATARSQSR